MNAVSEVMKTCEQSGVKVSVRGANLRVDAPKGLSDSLKNALRQHKAEIIRTLTQKPVNLNTEIAPTLIERLNSMIAAGAAFDVAADDFQVVGAKHLTEADEAFLIANKAAVLCTLQQAFLQKHLFDYSPELLEAFKTEVNERSAIVTDGGNEVVFQAVREVAAEWIAEQIGML